MENHLPQLIRQLPTHGFTLHAAPDSAAIQLLLIDFDGTLADTLCEEGFRITEEEYHGKYFGMRCTEFMEALGFSDPAERERLRQRKIALYPRHFDTVRLNQPLWDFTQEFRASGGKAWIVSTGSRANIENVMKHLGITEGVDGILTGADVVHSKPAPDCFLKAMEIESTTPQQTLIFEDSAIGLEAARRSGASYVAVKL